MLSGLDLKRFPHSAPHGAACGTISKSGCQLAIPKPATATTVHKAYALWAQAHTSGTNFSLNGQLLVPNDVTYVDASWRNQAKDVTDIAAAALDNLPKGNTYLFNVT